MTEKARKYNALCRLSERLYMQECEAVNMEHRFKLTKKLKEVNIEKDMLLLKFTEVDLDACRPYMRRQNE